MEHKEEAHPFLFYGLRPQDYFESGSFAVRFRDKLDTATKRAISGEIGSTVASRKWKGQILWIDPGYDPSGEEIVLPLLQKLHGRWPIAEAVNHCARDGGEHPWTTWSFSRQRWPSKELLLDAGAFSPSNAPLLESDEEAKGAPTSPRAPSAEEWFRAKYPRLATPAPHVLELEELMGRTFPSALRDYLGHRTPRLELPPEANAFEHLVLAAQRDPANCSLMPWLLNSVFLMEASEYDDRPERNPIFAFLPLEEAGVDIVEWGRNWEVISDALEPALCILDLYRDWREGVSLEDLRKRLRPLYGRFSENGPYMFMFDPMNAKNRILPVGKKQFDKESLLWEIHSRAQWISHALTHGTRADGHARISTWLMYDDYRNNSWESLCDKPIFVEPIVALYYLWRDFLLGRDAEVAKLTAQLKDSPARLTRDAVRLVTELTAGRKTLGAIDDIGAVREETAEAYEQFNF